MESAAIELMIVNAIERAGLAMRKAVQPMRAPDELLTIQEVAKVLKVGVNYANMLVQSGIIPGIKMNGMKVRRHALEEWMASMEGLSLEDPAHPKPIEHKEAKTA